VDRLERTLSIEHGFEAAEAADREYWWAQTPAARIAHVCVLWRLNHGDRAARRLRRILEVVERPSS